jgi:multiple sugar transport system substrate-binding protein
MIPPASSLGAPLARRRVLLGLIGASAATLLAACGAPAAPTPAPTKPAADAKPAAESKPAAAAQAPAGAKKVDVIYVEWGEDERWMNAAVDRFNQENPDVNLIHQVEPSAQYLEKMVARFRAGVKTDVPQVRDNQFASWADAGFLQPVDGLNGLAELDADTFKENLEAMSYNGKRYGLVYYTDYMAYHWNKKMAGEAGVTEQPETYDQVREAALKIKQKGLAEYPINHQIDKASNGFLMWLYWTMLYGSGGHAFDQNNDPLFPEKDETTLQIAQWLSDAIQSWKILSANDMQPTTGMARINAGEAAITHNASYMLIRWPNEKQTKVPGQIEMIPVPTFKKKDRFPEGTVMWTRMYTLAAKTDVKDQAWRAMYFLGGKNKEGKYWNSLNWLENDFKYTGFKSFRDQPEAQAVTRKYGDPKLVGALSGVARAREALKEPWWTDWDVFHQGELQAAMLGKKTPTEAVRASAAEAKRLKAEFKK